MRLFMDALESDIAVVAAIAAVPAILEIVCRTTGMGFAAVARVTEDRWVACSVLDKIAFGLEPGGELPVATTICSEIRDHGRAVAIDDVQASAEFRAHATPQLYGFRSYISVPIVRQDGRFFGTLCAIDPRPAMLENPGVASMFGHFAELIAAQLDSAERMVAAEQALSTARDTATLREQFIAVLGHDLRSPLTAIGGGTTMLGREQGLSERGRTILGLMDDSLARAFGLIDDVLDFARGRLGGGLAVDADPAVDLGAVLAQAVAEARGSAPGRAIDASIDLPEPVRCDPKRIAQLAANLLGNALVHGAADTPVEFTARDNGAQIEIEVANGGTAIPPEAQAKLFEPFFRQEAGVRREGLGLGLYIASEIAKAHGGTLALTSDATRTVFRFTMPRSATPVALTSAA